MKLEEVIITGFGTKSKNSYTGAATTVKREQLLSVGTKNLLQSLAAFVPVCRSLRIMRWDRTRTRGRKF